MTEQAFKLLVSLSGAHDPCLLIRPSHLRTSEMRFNDPYSEKQDHDLFKTHRECERREFLANTITGVRKPLSLP